MRPYRRWYAFAVRFIDTGIDLLKILRDNQNSGDEQNMAITDESVDVSQLLWARARAATQNLRLCLLTYLWTLGQTKSMMHYLRRELDEWIECWREQRNLAFSWCKRLLLIIFWRQKPLVICLRFCSPSASDSQPMAPNLSNKVYSKLMFRTGFSK